VSFSIFSCASLICFSITILARSLSAISAATLKRSIAFLASPFSFPATAAHKLIED